MLMCIFFQHFHLFVRKHAAAGEKAHAFRCFQRETSAAAWHNIDEELCMPPVFEPLFAHIEGATVDFAEFDIARADAELTLGKTHGR